MAQWEAMFSQLSAEEKAEWNNMSPQERTEMRHELEAEEAEEDRLAESERVSTAAADFKEAKQTTHEPILEGLTDKVLGRGSSNIGNPLGEDAPGYHLMCSLLQFQKKYLKNTLFIQLQDYFNNERNYNNKAQ